MKKWQRLRKKQNTQAMIAASVLIFPIVYHLTAAQPAAQQLASDKFLNYLLESLARYKPKDQRFLNESEYLLESMNFEIPPCENFYQFVCGNFRNTEILDLVAETNWKYVHEKMAVADYYQSAPAYIQTAITASRNIRFKTATKEDMSQFTDKIFRELLDISGISNRIFSNEADIPEPTAIQLGIAVGYLASRSLFPLFLISTSNFISSNRDKLPFVLHLQARNFTDPPPKWFIHYFADTIKQFRLQHEPGYVEEYFYANEDTELMNFRSATAIYDFLMALSEFHQPSPHAGFTERHSTFTVDDLAREFEFIDWKEMINATAQYVHDSTSRAHLLQQNLRVQISGIQFFHQLKQGFSHLQINRSTIARYLLAQLSSLISATYSDGISDRAIPPGLNMAYQRIFADMELSKQNENRRIKISQLADRILDSWKIAINHSHWMTDTSKQKSLQKASQMTKHIGYPLELMNHTFLTNYYEQLNVSKDDSYVQTLEKLYQFNIARKLENIFKITSVSLATQFGYDVLLTKTAFNLVTNNAITLPLSYIRTPIYNPAWPASHAYGGIGFSIGHEIGHAHGTNGIHFGDVGQVENQLDETSMIGYKKYAKCIANEYSTMCTTMANASLECLDGTVSLNENMADQFGIRLAYHAFKSHTELYGPEPPLPVRRLRHYNHNQLFFIYYARSWCQHNAPTAASHESYGYSPYEHRILGTLRNFPPFQSTFSCQQTAAMVKRDRCDLSNYQIENVDFDNQDSDQ